jgi:hypothetical protein
MVFGWIKAFGGLRHFSLPDLVLLCEAAGFERLIAEEWLGSPALRPRRPPGACAWCCASGQ